MGKEDHSIRTTLSKLALMFDRSIGLSVYSGNSGLDAALLLAKGAIAMVSRLESPQAQFVLEAFGKVTFVDDGNGYKNLDPSQMDTWFQKYPEDFGDWISKCIEVNFVDFLSSLGNEGKRLKSLFNQSGLLKEQGSQKEKEEDSASSQDL